MAKKAAIQSHPVPPYGTAIQQAIVKGDLGEMKQMVKQSEQFLAENGDIRSALEVLKIEIHKLESKKLSR
jgi:hypothetical protein